MARRIYLSAVALAITTASLASAQTPLHVGSVDAAWVGTGTTRAPATGESARLQDTEAIAIGHDGTVYVGDNPYGVRVLNRINPDTAAMEPIMGVGAVNEWVRGMALNDDSNTIILARHDNALHEFDPAANTVGPILTSGISAPPTGIAKNSATKDWYIGLLTSGIMHRVPGDAAHGYRPSSSGVVIAVNDAGANRHAVAVRQTTGAVYTAGVKGLLVFVEGSTASTQVGSADEASGVAMDATESAAFVSHRTLHRVGRYDIAANVYTVVVGSAGLVQYKDSAEFSYDADVRNPFKVATYGNTLYIATEAGPYGSAVAKVTLDAGPYCSCPSLHADLDTDAIPDATQQAEAKITLDETTWDVVFRVEGVKLVDNGHVIASAVNTHASAADAFTPHVSAFDAGALWNPPKCKLGAMDTPAASMGVAARLDEVSCTKNYEMRYNLLQAGGGATNQHCDLSDDGTDIKVNCSIILTTVRSYSASESWAFTGQEAAFAAEITLTKRLNREVSDLLHATLAKCSVKSGPLFVVDCRVPGLWDFDQSKFAVSQVPAGWIDATTCASTQTAVATFIQCKLNSSAPVGDVQTALANITAEKVGAAGDAMTFDVEYIVPRLAEYSTSASLQSFVKEVRMAEARFYYGTADVATLEVEVVDTTRLAMSQIELFNSATPVEAYNLRGSDAPWSTVESNDATVFRVEFAPAAMRSNAAFYRNGPHGVNVSFVFTAARRREEQQPDGGFVTVSGLRVEGAEEVASSGAGPSESARSGTAVVGGLAVGGAVLAAGLIGAAIVVAVRRRRAQEEQEQL